jgi:hypothetical protein
MASKYWRVFRDPVAINRDVRIKFQLYILWFLWVFISTTWRLWKNFVNTVLLAFLSVELTGSILCIECKTRCLWTVIPRSLRPPCTSLKPAPGVVATILRILLSRSWSDRLEYSLPSTRIPNSWRLRRNVLSEIPKVRAISLQAENFGLPGPSDVTQFCEL